MFPIKKPRNAQLSKVCHGTGSVLVPCLPDGCRSWHRTTRVRVLITTRNQHLLINFSTGAFCRQCQRVEKVKAHRCSGACRMLDLASQFLHHFSELNSCSLCPSCSVHSSFHCKGLGAHGSTASGGIPAAAPARRRNCSCLSESLAIPDREPVRHFQRTNTTFSENPCDISREHMRHGNPSTP